MATANSIATAFAAMDAVTSVPKFQTSRINLDRQPFICLGGTGLTKERTSGKGAAASTTAAAASLSTGKYKGEM